jgi:hypothetical protein
MITFRYAATQYAEVEVVARTVWLWIILPKVYQKIPITPNDCPHGNAARLKFVQLYGKTFDNPSSFVFSVGGSTFGSLRIGFVIQGLEIDERFSIETSIKA